MKRRKPWLPIAASLLLLALDQWTKHLATVHLTDLFPLIPGVVGLQLTYNIGGAFSLPLGGPWAAGLLGLALLGAGGTMMLRLARGRWLHAAMVLIAAGGASNLADRFTRGAVVDMIRLLFIPFPIFNLADICITIGVGALVLSIFLAPDEWKERRCDK